MSADPSSTTARSGGLEGVVVADSSMCFIDGQKGELVYRGFDIDELAWKASYEETAFLLWNDRLPTRAELDDLREQLASFRSLPDEVSTLLATISGRAGAMETMRTAVSMMASFDPDVDDPSEEANRRKSLRMAGAMTTILASHVRLADGEAAISPRDDLGHAANFLYMLTGRVPSDTAARAFDAALVLHAEHGFNASTFSARVTAATLSDIYSAVVSAIGTLKGPLHGGANRAVMQTLEEIGSVDRVESAVKERLARKERIMGFGHRVYKVMDPRAVHLKKMAADLGKDSGESLWYDMSVRMEEVMLAEKGLNPNVDFYSAAAYRALGIPARIYPAVFACSRIAGWTGHVMEQFADNRLIRPRSRYVGGRDRKFRPLGERD